jgi:nucleoside-diphosphate-sugar epimerase
MTDVLAIGAGYSVRPLLEALAAAGRTVSATTRDASRAEALTGAGVTPLLWCAGDPLPLSPVPKALIVSVPPQEDGCPVAAALRAEDAAAIGRVIYLASSGVYGDHDGDWVDETTPCRPGTDRGTRRLEAEADWRSLVPEGRLVICRLAGIYGPGRNAAESLLGETRGSSAGLGQRVIKPGQVFNRIHRDDIAVALGVLLDMPAPPAILNFADDLPSPPQDVIAYAADLLGVAPPPEVPFEKAALSPMARSFYADNKRLRNDRLKALPGFQLRYPTYREGLDAIVSGLGAGSR